MTIKLENGKEEVGMGGVMKAKEWRGNGREGEGKEAWRWRYLNEEYYNSASTHHSSPLQASLHVDTYTSTPVLTGCHSSNPPPFWAPVEFPSCPTIPLDFSVLSQISHHSTLCTVLLFPWGVLAQGASCSVCIGSLNRRSTAHGRVHIRLHMRV